MNTRMIGNNVLLEPLPQAQQSPGGIHYVQTYRDDQTQWRVLSVGPGKVNKKGILIALEVKPGDRVVAPLYHDHAVLADGRRVVDAGQIIAVFGSEAP